MTNRELQFQHKPSPNPSILNYYPLFFDQRLAQADRYREAAEHLNVNLRNIDQYYASSNAQAHNGGLQCATCAEKNRRIKQAFYEYYFSNQPGRWDERRPEYRQNIEQLFIHPDPPLDTIHGRFKTGLKDHLRKDLCTVGPKDTKDVADQKMRLDQLLLDLPLEDALSRGFQQKIDRLTAMPGSNGQVGDGNTEDPTSPAGFNVRLQGVRTAEKRAALYMAYYCTPGPDDSPQLRSLKSKYAKHFEVGMSYDTVLGMWTAESKEAKARDLKHWQQRLAEIQMAQSAHLKAKQKKMMKENAKMKETKHIVECSLPSCDRQMDKSKEEVTECAICDWLARRFDQRRHTYYCSQFHNDEDFVGVRKFPRMLI